MVQYNDLLLFNWTAFFLLIFYSENGYIFTSYRNNLQIYEMQLLQVMIDYMHSTVGSLCPVGVVPLVVGTCQRCAGWCSGVSHAVLFLCHNVPMAAQRVLLLHGYR
jgi:hypothetical protein